MASRAGSLGRGCSIAEVIDLTPARATNGSQTPRGRAIRYFAARAGLPGHQQHCGPAFSDADLDWRDAERMRFVLDVLTEGLA